MVVGADIEDGVVLTVVPLHQLVVLADEREEAVLSGAGLMFASLFYLEREAKSAILRREP